MMRVLKSTEVLCGWLLPPLSLVHRLAAFCFFLLLLVMFIYNFIIIIMYNHIPFSFSLLSSSYSRTSTPIYTSDACVCMVLSFPYRPCVD
jgi:hypothetical protein